jgi:5-methylthioadenosine/S-adenosylhomocysteine deaminase
MEKFKILFILVSLFLLIFPLSAFSQLKNKPIAQKNVPKWDADLVIVGGTVVTMDKDRRVIEDGAVVITNGEVGLVGKRAAVTKNLRARQTIDATGKIVIPGLINTHTHVPMSLFRGIADDLDLQEWLTKYIFPAEAKNVTEDFVRVGTQLGMAEMIRGGTTTYCDMYYFEDAVADETYKAGMRGVLGETIIDFPVADNKTHEEAMAYTERFINKWKNNALIVPALAPHAPYTVSTEHLQAVRRVSDRTGAPIVIHVSETKKEVDDSLADKNKKLRPFEYLNKINFLNNRVIAAHTVHINDKEIDLLKKFGVGSAHCPQSNMKLASGVAPIPQMLLKDIAVGLGTDGAASNNDLSMWEEMDSAAKLHKVFSGDPKVVNAEQAFEMATIRGARALHMENLIGSIEAGKRADIVLVDSNDLNQTPFYNIYSSLVYATKASDVQTVIIDGKVIMRDRRLLTLNENVIKKNANLYRQKIIKSLTDQ